MARKEIKLSGLTEKLGPVLKQIKGSYTNDNGGKEEPARKKRDISKKR